MEWILDPRVHFPPQQDGDLVDDGVCVAFITDKLQLSQPTATAHLRVLMEAGLVSSKKIKNWVFYKPRRDTVANMVSELAKILEPVD